MAGLLSNRPDGRVRLIGFVLVLAIFFLPLHFHALNLAPQVNKECSCLSGSRTQAGLAIVAVGWLPLFEPYAIAPEVQHWPDLALSRAVQIRAPPVHTSL